MTNQFAKDVYEGLNSNPKCLPSKYFYDTKGSEIFVEIMKLPEYYLTRSEFEIFEKQSQKIIEAFQIKQNESIEIIELGAGDGYKTVELLKKMYSQFEFTYKPIDISKGALLNLEKNIKSELPDISMEPIQGDFFETLHELQANDTRKVVLFLGSTLGNMVDRVAKKFIESIAENLNKNDILLLGLDLIKSKEIVVPAYNDVKGITSSFNFNLLQRINNELDANFNLEYFEHAPEYSEETGIAKSFLKSTRKQTVVFDTLDFEIDFEKNEKIFTEISRKYDDSILQMLVKDSGFEISEKIMDEKKYFADYILKKEL
ncbi:L-histidine N(alpha)-methyltransferase [Aureivirga sp. CE67]|uniref:L-histidine N(alpha)-methyltransferase n=1 Tax=Aureivirga sp. CE67 TaxID=1788983 RepID=UPI0018CAA6DD|nr:L-histidine N(alpha)-methyltransferase [Aureivirga sp. CE67]